MLSDHLNHHHYHQSQPEPSHDEPAPPPRVVTIISNVLEKLVARNDQLALLSKHKQQQKWMNNNGTDDDDHRQLISAASIVGSGKSLKGFDGVRTPSISIPNYLERMYKYTKCSPSCFVVGYVYLDRLIHKYPDSLVDSLNVHRLLVTCVMVASKMLDDEHYNNEFFARVGGVTNSELNRLELELLFLLDFGVSVSSQVFEIYCQHLEKQMHRNGTAIDYLVRPAITNSCADDHPTEISVEDHSPSSSSHGQTMD